MKCLNCGKELNNDELFCPYCGTAVDDKTADFIQSTDKFEKTDAFNEMVCKHCGETLSKDATFCKFCGKAVGNDFTNIKQCQFCGSEIKSAESVFCNNCGKKIASDSDVKGDDSSKGLKKELFPYIILLVVVVICCAGIITYVYQKNNSNYVDMPEINIEQPERNIQSEPVSKNQEKTQIETMSSPEFETVNASSVLTSDGQNTYYVENIWDDNKNTAWVEGASGNGIGEVVSLSAPSKQSINGIRVLNGYCKSESLYWKNSRIKKIKIILDEENIIFDMPDNFNQYHDIKFEKVKLSSTLKLEIVDVYPGTHYTDTCVSEIEIY